MLLSLTHKKMYAGLEYELLYVHVESEEIHQISGVYCTCINDFKKLQMLLSSFYLFTKIL